MADTPVSPKVTTAGVTTAGVTLVMYLLGQWSFVAQMPGPVQGALLVLVTAAATFAAAYTKGDPLRAVERNGRRYRGERGAISASEALLLALTLAVIVLLAAFLV